MDADFRFPSIYVPSTCTHCARPAPAYPETTGRAATGRAGSFNSGKNVTVLPVVEVRRTGTGKNNVLPARPTAARRTGPPDGGSDPQFPLSTSLTLPARADRLSCFFSVPASDIYQPLRNPCSLCAATRVVYSSWTPTRADLRSGASPRDTLTRATLPAAPPQALRAIHSDRRLASCTVSLPHSCTPSG